MTAGVGTLVFLSILIFCLCKLKKRNITKHANVHYNNQLIDGNALATSEADDFGAPDQGEN